MPVRKSADMNLLCPLCDVEVPMSGDEEPGEEIYCPYCETPLKLMKNKDDTLYLKDDM